MSRCDKIIIRIKNIGARLTSVFSIISCPVSGIVAAPTALKSESIALEYTKNEYNGYSM
jgi:hypothetical protein